MNTRTTIAVLLAVGGLWAGGCGRPGEREFHEGLRELGAGRPVEARTWLERSVARRPGSAQNARALNYLGLVCLQLNDLPAAAAAFEESRRLDPTLPEPAVNLAMLRAQAGDTLQAAALLNEAALLDPASPRAHEQLGHLHAGQRRWAEARAAFDEAVQRDPESPRLRTALAVAAHRMGDADAARLHLTAAVDRAPDYAPAAYAHFALYREVDDLAGAAESWARRFLELAGEADPRAGEVAGWLRTLEASRATSAPRRPPPREDPAARTLAQAETHAREGRREVALAMCLMAAEQARKAGDEAGRERALRRSLEWAPNQVRAQVAWGRWLLEKNRAPEALAVFRLATSLDPAMAEAHAGRGEAAARTKEWDDASISLRRALELDPDHGDARWTLARMLDEALNRPADAVKEYREFTRRLAADPRSVRAAERLRALEAETAARPPPEPPPSLRTPPADAEAPPLPATGRRVDLRAEARPKPQEALQALTRGQQHMERGDGERAQYEFRRALELNADSATAWFNLAQTLHQRGDPDLAVDAFREGLAREPANAPMRYNAALSLHALGRTAEARAQLDHLVRTQPEYAAPRYLLGLLEAAEPDGRTAARAHFEEFLRLSPRDPNAPAVREWLANH
jgi:tetratricopeptide (TPR) repeat protein